MKYIYSSLLSLTFAALPVTVAAQLPADDPSVTTEITDSDEEFDLAVRQNPVEIPDEADDIDIPIPFIKRSSNHIIYNGADWSKLRAAFEGSFQAPVSIVHIGDSHVQADINTGTTRELLQYDFGNAGRGLIAPLRISVPTSLKTMCFKAAIRGMLSN